MTQSITQTNRERPRDSAQAKFSDWWYHLTYERYESFRHWRNTHYWDEVAFISIPMTWGYKVGRIGYYATWAIPKSPWFWAALLAPLMVLGFRKYIKHVNVNRAETLPLKPPTWLAFSMLLFTTCAFNRTWWWSLASAMIFGVFALQIRLIWLIATTPLKEQVVEEGAVTV